MEGRDVCMVCFALNKPFGAETLSFSLLRHLLY